MGSLFMAAVISAGLGMSSGPAATANVVKVGGDCSAAAQQVAAQTGGQVLSAQPSNGQCVVTVLVPVDGGPPKKMTVRVPM